MTDTRIAKIVQARNHLRDVSMDVPDHTPAHKALRAAVLAAEVAWQQIEEFPDEHPALEDLP